MKQMNFEMLQNDINKAVREIKLCIMKYNLNRDINKHDDNRYSLLHIIHKYTEQTRLKYKLPIDTFRVEQGDHFIRVQKTIGTELGRAVYRTALHMKIDEFDFGSYFSNERGIMFMIENILDYKNKSTIQFYINEGQNPYIYKYIVLYHNPDSPRCLYPNQVEIHLLMNQKTKQLEHIHHHRHDIFMKDGNNVLLDMDVKRRYQSMPRDLKEFEYDML